MAKFRKIGVLTSGGDAPGMNACVKAVVNKANSMGIEVVGIIGGYAGLIHGEVAPLTNQSVTNVICNGGTCLFSSRSPEFKTEEGMQAAIKTCRENQIDALVCIGGDGTFRGATDMTKHGFPSVGLPGTIDNDITATDYTIGLDTAINSTVSMIDNLRDTGESHSRVMVVEVMGRDCGQIALSAAVASGAVAVAIPEVPFDEAAAIRKIHDLRDAGKKSMIVIVSEGVKGSGDLPYAEELTKKIDQSGVEARFVRFAHIVRGGKPTQKDRCTATEMGVRAVEELVAGHSDLVICEINGSIKPVDIRFSLVVDRMYKNKLKDGDLDGFSNDQLAAMKKLCEQRKTEIQSLYAVASDCAF